MIRQIALLLLSSLALDANQAVAIDSAQGHGASILKSATEEDRLSHDRRLTEEQRNDHKTKYHQALRAAYSALLSESNAGNADSMWRLGAASGVFQREGFTTRHEGTVWLRKAASLGHEEAPFELALQLLEIGDADGKIEGFRWLKKSTQIGCRRWQAAVELARYYTYGFPEIKLKRSASAAWAWIDKGAELMGCSKGEFMAENGLADPRTIKKSQILFE